MEISSTGASGTASVQGIDMKLEVVVVPVSDVDRAKKFYRDLGWRLDADRAAEDYRLVQFTPPGSGCGVSGVVCVVRYGESGSACRIAPISAVKVTRNSVAVSPPAQT